MADATVSEGEALAVRYHETGAPCDVLRVEAVPVPPPGPGEVTVRLLAAPIHPSDLGMIAGTYGRQAALPAVAGREGVGEIVAVGPGTHLGLGSRVRMPSSGAWITQVTTPEAGLVAVPRNVPLAQAAMAFVNPPTVVRLLRDFVTLQPGDWVVQNAANSAVGQGVAALARHWGLQTVNFVRDVPRTEAALRSVGADVILPDTDDGLKALADATGGAKPRLALNSVGGESVVRLIRALGDSGVCVTFGGMVGDRIRYPTRNLIFNDIALRGFWMDRWLRTHLPAEVEALFNEVFDLLAAGILAAPIGATYPLHRALEAVPAAAEPSRPGKILLLGPNVTLDA